MKMHDFENLDDFIENALRSDPMRPVPAGFARGVEQRLKLARLLDAERRRFRRCFAVAGALSFTVTFGLVALAMMNDTVGAIAYRIPGLLGYVDYAVAMLQMYWLPVATVALVLIGGVAAGLAAVEWRLRRKWAVVSKWGVVS